MKSEKSEKSENQKALCSTCLQSVGVRKPANAGVKSGKREKWKARKVESEKSGKREKWKARKVESEKS
ncbi:MAG: hypothetical protein WCV67_16795, partial [Victivallaceae bacterium]